MATAKEPKKAIRSKKVVNTEGQQHEPKVEAENKVAELPKKASKKNKLSINKVHNLFPEESTKEDSENTAPKKETKKKVLEEKNNKSYLISFENTQEIELLQAIQNFAQTSGNSVNKAILVLAEQALKQPKDLFFKPDPQFSQELNENFKKVEDKIQSEIDNFKLELLEQFQCLLETKPDNPKDQKSWLQNILKYI